MAIIFHEGEISAGIRNKNHLKKWLQNVIQLERARPGNINIVFTTDQELASLNQAYLEKHELTYIITFDYTESKIIEGDLFISLPRVKENATIFNMAYKEELKRVILHGILHMLGHDDKNEQQRIEMRSKEDFYLMESPEI